MISKEFLYYEKNPLLVQDKRSKEWHEHQITIVIHKEGEKPVVLTFLRKGVHEYIDLPAKRVFKAINTSHAHLQLIHFLKRNGLEWCGA
jgi:hypothetical protein